MNLNSETTIRGESHRSLIENFSTRKRKIQSFTFVIHKRTPQISDGVKVSLKDREVNYLKWDDKITFEFNGKSPAVKSLKIE